MKIAPTKFGGTQKQWITLGVLMVVLIGVYFYMRDPSPTSSPTAAVTTTPKDPLTVINPVAPRGGPATSSSSGPRVATRSGSAGRSVDEFRPSLKPKEGVDLTNVNPVLRTDLLAKLQNVPMEGGARSVFDFGTAAPLPSDIPAIKPIRPVNRSWTGPMPAPAPMPTPTVQAPPPVPIPLKFYGFARQNPKRAFFMDGDLIQIAGENEVIRNRYKVVRIGVNSVVMEDLNTKSQQTLPLVEEEKT